MPKAIQLACDVIPHAVETLAISNPLGAKPVLLEMFQAELTPNLCREFFFPVSHRYNDIYIYTMYRHLSIHVLAGERGGFVRCTRMLNIEVDATLIRYFGTPDSINQIR